VKPLVATCRVERTALPRLLTHLGSGQGNDSDLGTAQDWPWDGVDIRLVVTIDTECDKHGDGWGAAWPLSFRSVTVGLAERLQPTFDRHGIQPTYLISPEVLRDPESRRVLERLPSTVEIGSHLHGEHIDFVARRPPLGPGDFQCRYAPDVEFERMSQLTRLFEDVLGRRPRSFRAGRFGAGPNTLRCLEELGYENDGSVTPHIRWGAARGEMDFTIAPEQPYFPAFSNIARCGTSRILEIPVSIIGSTVGDLLRSAVVMENGQSWLRRAARRVTRRRWLQPAIETVEGMLSVCRTLVQRHRASGQVVLSMMLHAGEVVPGATPSSRTEQRADEVLLRLDSMLDALVAAGARTATMAEIGSRCRSAP
jgi:hypothetical protein